MQKIVKRFSLIYEPKGYYIDNQYIINFKLNKTKSDKFIKIKKNTSYSDEKKGRMLLSEIDLITNQYENMSEFLKSIDLKSEIHALFINTSKNIYYGRISPVFGNESVNKLLDVTVDDTIISEEVVKKLYKNITKDDYAFASFFLSSDFYKSSSFKQLLFDIVNLYRFNKRTGYFDFESGELLEYETKKLKECLKKYYVARELTRAYDAYIVEKNNANDDKISSKNNNKVLTKTKIDKKNNDSLDDCQYKLPGW